MTDLAASLTTDSVVVASWHSTAKLPNAMGVKEAVLGSNNVLDTDRLVFTIQRQHI